MNRHAVKPDLSAPLVTAAVSPEQIDAAKGGRATTSGLVLGVLSDRADAKIGAPIVERVAVNVIDGAPVSTYQPAEQPMKRQPTAAMDIHATVAAGRSVPSITGQLGKVGIVHERMRDNDAGAVYNWQLQRAARDVERARLLLKLRVRRLEKLLRSHAEIRS